jgi:CheY-like chemotaxis protein
MIIEDDAIVRLGLQAVLEDGGDEVILAGSAGSATRWGGRFRPCS